MGMTRAEVGVVAAATATATATADADEGRVRRKRRARQPKRGWKSSTRFTWYAMLCGNVAPTISWIYVCVIYVYVYISHHGASVVRCTTMKNYPEAPVSGFFSPARRRLAWSPRA